MPSDVRIHDGGITITSGLYDTDDGVTLQVQGDPFPRVRLTPQGDVQTGDGSSPPAGMLGEVHYVGEPTEPVFLNDWINADGFDPPFPVGTETLCQFQVVSGTVFVRGHVLGISSHETAAVFVLPDELVPDEEVIAIVNMLSFEGNGVGELHIVGTGTTGHVAGEVGIPSAWLHGAPASTPYDEMAVFQFCVSYPLPSRPAA